MASWRSILVLALIMLAGASCRSLTAPPGFAGSGSGTAGRIEFPAGISLEAQYALLAWYEDQYGQEARSVAPATYGVALNARNARAVQLRQEAAQALVGRYPDFAYVPPQGGLVFLFETLGGRGDFAEMQAMLDTCRTTLSARRTVVVPAQECLAYLENSPNRQEEVFFQAWAEKHPELELEVQDEQSLKWLAQAKVLLNLKEQLLESISEADQAMADTIGVKALDILEDAEKALPANVDFSFIGDDTALAELREARQTLPNRAIQAMLDWWPKHTLDKHELMLSDALNAWEADSRFRPALRQADEKIRKVVGEMYQARLDDIREDAREHAETKSYWHFITAARAQALQLAGGKTGSWDCYARYGLAPKLQATLTELYEKMIPEAEAFYLSVQENDLKFFNRPGTVIVLGKVLEELCGEEPEMSRQRTQEARQLLANRPPLLTVCLEDFSSQEEGQGRTWTRDLQFAVKRVLKDWNAASFFELTDSMTEADCILTGGELLEFSAGEVERNVLPNWHRWYGKARMENVNGRLRFVQDEWEEEITVQTSSRAGHVRLRASLRGTDFGRLERRERQFEQNVFYPKEFVQESAGTVRKIGEFFCDDQRELKPVGAAAELRKERIWSTGEMVDFTRQSALRECAELFCASLLELAAEERDELYSKDGKGEAVEFLSELQNCLDNLAVPGEGPLAEAVKKLQEDLPHTVLVAAVLELCR